MTCADCQTPSATWRCPPCQRDNDAAGRDWAETLGTFPRTTFPAPLGRRIEREDQAA